MYPDEQKIHDVELKVGLLQKDVELNDRLCSKLSESITKIQELNVNIMQMISLHEQPRRDLGRDGVRRPGRCAARVGAHRNDQPGEPCGIGGSHRHLQGRAVRHGGRRLRVRAAHRARRMELVHRLGRLDVPARRRIAAGPEARGRPAASRALPARGLADVQDPLPLSRDRLPHRRRASARRDARDGRRCRAA